MLLHLTASSKELNASWATTFGLATLGHDAVRDHDAERVQRVRV